MTRHSSPQPSALSTSRVLRTPRRAALVALPVSLALGAGALAGCTGTSASSADSDSGKSVSLAGFSVLKTANQGVIKDFQKTKAGKGATFTTSYGASGEQERAVEGGLKADEAHLSLEPDITKLVKAGIVGSNWKSQAKNGIATQSVVVLVVRKGNPKHIKSWADVVRPGVKVVTPNPGSSGSAKWNILAAYGQVLANGGSASDAKAYLKRLFAHVAALPSSGRDATTTFEGGTGDVLLSYENEAIEARQAGAKFDYVVPDQTLLIQNPAALTKKASPTAKAFLRFQVSKQGQTDYAEQGFRPLDSSVKVPVKGSNDPKHPFPTPKRLMTIDKDFGGWSGANDRFFGDGSGIVTKLLASAGKS